MFNGDPRRIFQVAGVVLLNQVGDDFGIRFGQKDVPFFLQLRLQRKVVFNDPIVDNDDIAFAIAVRMGILLGGPPVRGPPGVPDAIGTGHRVGPDDLFQVPQLPGGAPDAELPFRHHCDAGRIVSAILQAA